MVLIGHLDSGIQSSLPVFAGRLDSFMDFTAQRMLPDDTIGHGTATASAIALEVPNAHLWVARCTGNGHDSSRLLQGLDWFSRSPVHVICMPIGIPGIQPIFQSMINYLTLQGKLVVVPIGNQFCHSPGVYPNVLSVGAANSKGGPASFSPRYVVKATCKKPDVLAPGVGIKVLKPSGDIELANGTSYACAVASACVARLFEQFPKTKPAHMIEAITQSADQRPRTRSVGGNMRYDAALRWLQDHPDPLEEAVPSPIETYRDPYLSRLLEIENDQLHGILIAKDSMTLLQVQSSIQEVEKEVGMALAEKQFLADERTILLTGNSTLIKKIVESEWVQVASASQPDPHPKPFSFTKVYR